jgi:hypothetical protein
MAGWKKSRSANAWTLATDLELLESPPTGFIWHVPDEVWALDEKSRKQWFLQFESSYDWCSIDDRWFLRGDLELPYTNRPGAWKWGVWCEVDDSVIDKYAELEDVDGSNEPRMFGKLACKIPVYPDSVGLPVEIQFGPPDQRPSFFLPADSTHPLALEQREGIDEHRYHEIVAAVLGR